MQAKHVYAIFSARYAPQTGGVESFTQRLAHELVIAGNRVIVVTSRLDTGSSAHETQDDGVEVRRLPAWSFLDGRLPISRRNEKYKEALAELASAGVDRILVNARFYRHSLEGVRFAKRLGVPVIVLDHGSAHLTMGSKVVDWLVERYEHAMTTRIKGLCPSFAGISKASTAWLAHFGIETSDVIPNAIDSKAFQSSASLRSFRSEFGIDSDRVIVAFVGRLEQEKGPLELTRAMRLLGDGYVCLMAGDGSLRARIEKERGANTVLLGRVDQHDLSALLREADVFCLPSRSEGFCTSLLEAAAQNATPVMPHVGGTDEVMGWDPVRFGVGLGDLSPASIAGAIDLAASSGKAMHGELERYVTEHSSWKNTVEALDAAFAEIERD